jgi:hypothetical protein
LFLNKIKSVTYKIRKQIIELIVVYIFSNT